MPTRQAWACLGLGPGEEALLGCGQAKALVRSLGVVVADPGAVEVLLGEVTWMDANRRKSPASFTAVDEGRHRSSGSIGSKPEGRRQRLLSVGAAADYLGVSGDG